MKQLFFSKSFGFRVFSYQGEKYTDCSRGLTCHYVARLRSGRAMIRTLAGEELSLSPGDVFYLPMGLTYHSHWTPDKEKGLPVSWESYGFEYVPISLPTHYPMQILTPSGEAIALLDRLAEQGEVSPTSVGLLFLFLGEVLPTMKQSLPDAKEALLTRASAYIAAHPDLHVSDLARYLGMSESSLFRFFREFANTTPIAMKQQILAERAVRLLSNTDCKIEEITSLLSFCSAAHLRKTLKAVTGKTPSAIRLESKFM